MESRKRASVPKDETIETGLENSTPVNVKGSKYKKFEFTDHQKGVTFAAQNHVTASKDT